MLRLSAAIAPTRRLSAAAGAPLAGRVALVTGGGRGIGAAISRKLAARGATVAVVYREDGAAAAATVASLDGSGHAAFQCDVCDAACVAETVDAVAAALGGLDVVVNNAGVFEEHEILGADYAAWQGAWRRTLAANLEGPANVMYCAGNAMAKAGGGVVVNVSSRGAFRGEPSCPAYAASKAGLNAASQSLAQALAPAGVVVGVVAPGFVDTAMAAATLDGPLGPGIRAQSPFGRVASPDEVAEAVLYFTNPDAAWSSGAILDVNGASYLR